MTTQGDTSNRETSSKEHMTSVKLVKKGLLPPPAMNSAHPSTTVILNIVQGNNRDIQQIKANLLKQRASWTHVNLESQFFQKLHKHETFGSCQRDIVQEVF